jgi:hypothetical protein
MEPTDLKVSDIAAAMEVTVPFLWYFASHIEEFYLPTRKKRRKGKTRIIDEPKPEPKKHLRRLNSFFQRNLRMHPCAHGGVRGRSCFTSARTHSGTRFLITRDVADCYPSIPPEPLFQQILKRGFAPPVAKLLSMLLTARGRVPQGSPISSIAVNLFFYEADRRISRACRHFGVGFSRMSDDLNASVQKSRHVNDVGALLSREIKKLGLTVNENKRLRQGLQPRQRSVEGLPPGQRRPRVHNLDVADPKGIAIVPEQAKTVLALAEAFVRGTRCVAADSLVPLARKRSKIFGWLCHLKQAEISPWRHIKRLIKQGDRRVRGALDQLGLIAYKGKWWLRSSKRNEPARLARAWERKIVPDAA